MAIGYSLRMCARHVDSTNPGRSNLAFRSKPIAEAEMSNQLSLHSSIICNFTFSQHVPNLIRSSYFHLRRLRVIRCSVSSHVFTSIAHAFVCSRVDYLLLQFSPGWSPIQSVLNAAARLIARLPRTSHISAFLFDHLHWLPLIARIQLKVLTLIGQARILVRLPGIYVTLSAYLLLSSLFVRCTHLTVMIEDFYDSDTAVLRNYLWNQLPPST